MQPSLFTARLILRPFRFDDAPAITDYMQTPEIAANTARIPWPYEQRTAEVWIAGHEQDFADQREVSFAIARAEDERLVGGIGLTLDMPNRAAELGYWIGKPWWRRGYASEAAQCVVDWGFDALDLNRIHAGHMPHNPASGQILTKVGMQHEGLRREHLIKQGRPVDLVLMGLLRRDWIARRERLGNGRS